ncbi:hypothetical protein ACFC6L_29990 [Kitasatospora phosalacinea]|uniref:hypothetical protein n=1 Tax=Kitasatospora phosalacinea TaxID=2065 RepID=UPI0035DB9D40
MTAFPAMLPSRYPEIAFTATITATAYPDRLPPLDVPALARLIRMTLRRAAQDAAARLDPADLPGALDILADHLARPRPLHGSLDHALRADVTVTLETAAAEATAQLVRARCLQRVEDTVFHQRAASRARTLADPAILAASLTLPDTSAWAAHLKDLKLTEEASRTQFTTALTSVAQLLGSARTTGDDPLDLQVLEILRSFLASFESRHQRKILITVLSDFMRAADRSRLATDLEQAADVEDRTTPEGTGGSAPPRPESVT